MKKLTFSHRSIFYSAMLGIAFFCLSAGAVRAQDYDTFQLGDGRFEITGKKPAAFAAIKSLYLEGATLKAAPGRRLQPQPPGTVKGEFSGKQNFKIKIGLFEGENLTLESVVVRGLSYRFEGKVSNFYPDENKVIAPQFKGTLIKLVNGKKTAEAKVTFVYLEPEF
jgi:hypothetical protein